YLAWPGWGRRWWNEKEPGRYMELVNTEGAARSGGERLSKDEAELEALMLGLRLVDGIKKTGFERRFGKSPAGSLCREGLIDRGLIRDTGENIALTEKGILFSNEVF
ncbi:MAG: coproporphyrinogen III oxidase, partial [Deltaproteobacteria bacterium]|nr:coproporphyrinogen III oxidase [Deltaproteobacteria bacterium]